MKRIIFFILILSVVLIIILMSGCANNELYSQYCKQDSDCVSEVDLNPECTHYCQGDECRDDLRVCKYYYKYSKGNKNLANSQCIWNEPCKKPDQVKCINNQCQSIKEEKMEKECNIDTDCIKGGCSGTICQSRNSEPIFTTCEVLPEHVCYNQIKCGCIDGKCQWDKTEGFNDCVEKARKFGGEVIV